jgi:anti-anti-sigma factor
MTTTICNPATGLTIAPFEPAGAMKLTELVRGNIQRLLDGMGPLVRRQSVTLDLASVVRIDAAGISALVSLYTAARDAGHNFAVTRATPRVSEILALVGLDRVLVSHNAASDSHSGLCFHYRAA